jgi:ribosomal-protein-alanine N-acetyltransferase
MALMMITPTLETPRLRLRPLRLDDAPRIQEIFPHWEILEYLSAAIPWPYPDDGARTFLEATLPKVEAGQEYDWAITLKSENNDQPIGIIALYPGREENRGFWLGKYYHRQGLMTEAVCAVNDFAFDTLGLTHLNLNNAEPNLASNRLKEISGAKIVALNDDVPYVGGKFRQVRWLLTRDDWHTHRHLSCP